MAKDRSNGSAEQAQEAQANASTPAPAATPTAASTVDSRVIMVKDPDTGQMIRRTDFIRKCWVEKKMGRGPIAKLLSKLNEEAGIRDPKDPTKFLKVPYQAVFAVIKKGTPGGPDVPVQSGGAAPQAPAVEAGA